jgi:hypothetical protein
MSTRVPFHKRKWVRRIVRGGIVLIVVIVLGALATRYTIRYQGQQRLAEQIAHLDTTDPRWRWEDNEADRETIPDAENSVLVLVPKFEAARAGRDVEPKRPNGENIVTRDVENPNRLLTPEDSRLIAKSLDENKEVVLIARMFEKFPRGRQPFPPFESWLSLSLEHTQTLRKVVGVLRLDAERLSLDNQPDDAIALVYPILHAGNALRDEQTLISQLVRIAINAIAVGAMERTLALGEPRVSLKDVQSKLLRESQSQYFFVGMRGERAGMHRMCEGFESGQLTPDKLDPELGNSGGVFSWAVVRTCLPVNHANLLASTTKVIEARNLPEHEQFEFMKAFEDEVKRKKSAGLFGRLDSLISDLLMPAITRVHMADLRGKAQLRCAAVGLALEQYRIKYGRWPNRLDELRKDFLAVVPLDPFDGKPLRYAHRDDGVSIYSIGNDGKDDGGQIRSDKELRDQSKDIVFRLYNPDQRRLPPLPPKNDDIEFWEWELGPEPRTVEDRK